MARRRKSPQALEAEGVARLDERCLALQRQVTRLEVLLAESEHRITQLTDAKFVTYRTLIDSQAEKVALALEATEKAIDKAEVATSRAIEKESVANFDRFAKVNEFRAQQTELIARFATLERVDLLDRQANQRVEELNKNLTARIGELVQWRDRSEGQGQGVKENRNGIYAAIGAAGVLISIVVIIANLLSTTH